MCDAPNEQTVLVTNLADIPNDSDDLGTAVAACADWGGRVWSSGSGTILATFAHPDDALAAAFDVERIAGPVAAGADHGPIDARFGTPVGVAAYVADRLAARSRPGTIAFTQRAVAPLPPSLAGAVLPTLVRLAGLCEPLDVRVVPLRSTGCDRGPQPTARPMAISTP